MSRNEYVAITVSGQSESFGGLCIENIYMVETVAGLDPLSTAVRVVQNRLGRDLSDKEVVYEVVTDIPDLVARNDIVWLTPRSREERHRSHQTNDPARGRRGGSGRTGPRRELAHSMR